MFYIIRASSDFEIVIVVKLKNIKGCEPAQHYLSDARAKDGGFKEITMAEAEGYFSGMADGMGFGKLPSKGFRSLKNLKAWINGARAKAFKESYRIYSTLA